ncbi:DUF1553 domain-containing protein [Singulisphaera acidiphila]|uniref:PA14 domain-containing protein n=1 Tax=Singulisphaera acidiphila (strain ATCC BAA-1392 / DSM 18658 / VKM B-2454 / MOB10) TaxID=886293 RepID=L0D7J8_SINAD|nr:DUF1553 domain-containing protein [Singulisphaera acidiphila]AGA25359.1 PA14 domain-containing protein [Singulisphaera acidiphila DSM 18658]
MPRLPLRTMLLVAGLTGASATLCLAEESPPTPEQARFFETKVRPALVEHCTKCHGATKQKAGLRLDNRAGVLAGGDSGPAVVPGNLEESLLVTAISHEDADLKMPPSKKLDARLIADLSQWVKMGAPWPGSDETSGASAGPTPRKGAFTISDQDRAHWAFQPVRRPPVPPVKNAKWLTNPIDGFILAGLEAKGLSPNPTASKQELIRRASYDLTGLPPTPKEVETFLADRSPTAYEDLIDRLLDSPRYGEKWGRHWLDLVRFAETNSYERDNPKPNAWRYRDYVVRAFNRDLPYDRFIREQLAGDELPGADAEALIATGYYRLGIWDDEPTDREAAFYDGLDDLVATTSQVFLGLTVDCARCHDHKLDPIPQKDYYRLLSFFRNINHYRNGGPTDEQPILADDEARNSYARLLRERKQQANAIQIELSALESEVRARLEQEQGGGVGFRQADMDDLHYRFYRDTWDLLPDFNVLKPEETGTLRRPFFDLSPRTRNEAFGFVFEGVLIVPEDGNYTFHLDSDDGSRLSVAGQMVVEYDGIHGTGEERTASVALAKGRIPIRLDYFQKSHGLGLSVAWAGPNFTRRPLSLTDDAEKAPDLAQLMQSEAKRILGPARAERYQQAKLALKELEKKVDPASMALCITEAGTEAPETFVLLRGNPHVRGDKVEPAFLEVLGGSKPAAPTLPPGAKTSGRRLALADWIAASENPLSTRVMANRIWQHHFGRGIVRSSNNLGLQGDKPTHPELLDWLAAEFIAQGWRLKPLHRAIMTSSTYRMSSKPNEEALAKDPINDSFWRFEMRRLSAEEIRDSILAVTGALNLKMYGPGVYPEIPPEVMAGQSQPGKGWGKSTPEEQARRSIYVHVKRSLLTPILESFDVPETDRPSPVRFSTTQPTQALAMLNSGFLNQQAGVLAARLRREAGEDTAKQVELALKLITGRPPAEADAKRGVELIDTLRSRYNADAGEALRSFCLVALNLNEFIYLD